MGLLWCLYDAEGKIKYNKRYHCKPCLDAQQANLKAGRSASWTKLHSISVTTFSGNIKTHLYKKHSIDIDCEKKNERTKTLRDNWCSEAPRAANSSYELNRDVLLWFAEDLEPFSSVEKPGLNTFLKKTVH